MIHTLWGNFRQFIHKILYSPFGFQSAVLGVFIFFVVGFQPPYFFWDSQPFGESVSKTTENLFFITEDGFIDNFAGVQNAGVGEVIIKDEAGNFIKKIQPRKLHKSIQYIVKSGDSLIKIGHKFGLDVSTLLWSNDLTAKATLIPGKKLIIPPTDGVYYVVELGDTLGEIAKVHNIKIKSIYEYNKLNDKGTIKRGQKIFLPNAKKIYVQRTPILSYSTGKTTKKRIQTIGFVLLKPTVGVLTQRSHPGHTAIDIANKLNTPIYAAYDGVVSISKDGWNYGYGNYIKIDHKNNVQTLYAHLNARKVVVGQRVKKGELIGLMGHTGNVIGPTGIHLHFEVRINGRKVNPQNYF